MDMSAQEREAGVLLGHHTVQHLPLHLSIDL